MTVSMEAHPKAFFTTEQIASFASHLSQQGVRIYLGPTSPSLFYFTSFRGVFRGNFSASEYAATASIVLPDQSKLGCAGRTLEGGIDSISDDFLSASHGAKRIEESNKYLKVECNESHSYNANHDGGLDQVAQRYKSEQDDSSNSDMSEELLDLDAEEHANCIDDLVRSQKSMGKTQLKSREDLIKLPTIEAKSVVPPSNEVWHSRRSKSDVIVSKQRAHKKKMQSKEAKKSAAILNVTKSANEEKISRPKLKFMAAPGMKDKRKIQTTLMSMFRKK